MRNLQRILSLLLICAILLGCIGCTVEKRAKDDVPVAFYYVAQDAEQLKMVEPVTFEVCYVNVLSLWDLFAMYFSGPESEELVSPFPAGTHVLDIQYPDGKLTVKLSGEFFTLMGIEMSLASCCLANTICNYLNVDSVTLVDETESIRMEIQPKQFVLSNSLQGDADESFTIYFADSQLRYLISETRDATLSENETEMAYVMRKLLEGPENNQLKPIMPAGTELLGISCTNGICTLDFSYDFYENRLDNTYGAYMTIYGITNTLTGLDGIESVLFLVEGAPIERYGIFQLDKPVTRNSDCIGPVRMASGEIDIDIYILDTETQEPFAVPCRVKQTVAAPLAEAVTTRILNYEPPQGFYNPIPYGTELLSISVSGSVCYMDVSDKFIPQEGTETAEKAALWSLVAALTALDNISSVVLTINGESSGLRFVDISEPLTIQSISLD